jgi:hypothetical protein
VLAVHLALGLAPHMGHRTESICFNVSFPGFTTIVFSISGLERWSILLWGLQPVPKQESGRRGYFVGSRETTWLIGIAKVGSSGLFALPNRTVAVP